MRHPAQPSDLVVLLAMAASTMCLMLGFAALVEVIDRSIARRRLAKIAHDLGVRIQQQQQKRK